MLLLEQYLLIYLLSVFLIEEKDVKYICGFLVADFVIDSILYSLIKPAVSEYLITITILEITGVFFLVQLVKGFGIRNLFVLCYIPTLICPFFLLSIDHWITRDDIISYSLFIICSQVGKYSNEAFLTYLLYKFKGNSPKLVFWKTFIVGNYMLALAQLV